MWWLLKKFWNTDIIGKIYMLIILFIVIVTIVTIVVRNNKLKNGEYDYLFKDERQQENVVVKK